MNHDPRAYWNDAAGEKSFTLPLDVGWLAKWIPRDARILDFGCGYGRVASALANLGYASVVGVDFAERMIERGRRAHPALDLRRIDALPLAEPDASFDAALLFAVLTCIPDDDDQRALVAELRRLIRPGGLLYLSDFPLQSDERNRRRYERDAHRFAVFGVFETDDGARMRHFDEAVLYDRLSGFEPLDARHIRVTTLNGHPATALQILARRP